MICFFFLVFNKPPWHRCGSQSTFPRTQSFPHNDGPTTVIDWQFALVTAFQKVASLSKDSNFLFALLWVFGAPSPVGNRVIGGAAFRPLFLWVGGCFSLSLLLGGAAWPPPPLGGGAFLPTTFGPVLFFTGNQHSKGGGGRQHNQKKEEAIQPLPQGTGGKAQPLKQCVFFVCVVERVFCEVCVLWCEFWVSWARPIW